MSTSDLAHGLTTSPAESSKAGAADSDRLSRDSSLLAAASGFPDPALLEKMANEFFREIPGAASLSAADPTMLGAAPSANVSSLQLPPTLAPTLSVGSLTALPISAPAGNPTTASSTPPLPAAPVHSIPEIGHLVHRPAAQTPGIPGGFHGLNPSAQSAFGFLQDIRGIFNSVPAMPLNAAPMPGALIKMPAETQLAELAGSIGAPAVSVPRSADLPMPQVPGASIPRADFDRFASFNFLYEINPLEPLNVSPSIAPLPAELSAPGIGSLSSIPFDVNSIRRDFPILQERVNGHQLVWLDNAATTHKPQSVIDRLSYFYAHENSNVHRAAHTLAARATDAYENARKATARFLNAPGAENIIFVRGATEAINLVAQSWGRKNIQKDDEIVITWLEHHANIVPWQMLCSEKGARLRVAPVDSTGQIILEEYEKLLNSRTKLVSIAHVSNALGTIVPVTEMTEMAHRQGARVLVDGAQAVSHMPVDVQMIDCDFYVFSGHKVFAPTGIGVVYGKKDVLENTPPWQGGGNMIADVTFEKTIYQAPPLRFEAGTGNIADAVGLGAALDYVQRIGMNNIARYEHDLLVYGTESLGRVPGLHLIGTAREKASVMSFVLDGYDTEDVGKALAQQGIAVRAGHHCAQPILRRFGVERTVRPSLAFYNTCEEIDALVAAIWNLKSGRNPGLR
jgi:cysteine desulfurase / selenocysteine lyase